MRRKEGGALNVAVDCIIDESGQVRVRRIRLHDKWQPVEQGRQWRDESGQHVLVMLPGDEIREIVLRRDSILWVILPRQSPPIV